MGLRHQQLGYGETNFVYDQPSAAATTTVKVWRVPTGKTFRVDQVYYNNPTGLAQDAANYDVIELKDGSNQMAVWSTQTGQQGTLTADTPVNLVLSATGTNLVAASGDNLTIVITKNGTATLPAGRFVVFGRYV